MNTTVESAITDTPFDDRLHYCWNNPAYAREDQLQDGAENLCGWILSAVDRSIGTAVLEGIDLWFVGKNVEEIEATGTIGHLRLEADFPPIPRTHPDGQPNMGPALLELSERLARIAHAVIAAEEAYVPEEADELVAA